MASLDEAFVFPLTNKTVADKEQSIINIPGRGSYVPLPQNTDTYKPKKNNISDLKMYNSLKEQKQS
jgi:hypothetical protein